MSTDKRLYTEVVRQITQLIESGRFPAGSRLPGERDLAEQFGVSRVTVREAMIALQAQSRVEVRTGSGAVVLEAGPNAGLPSDLSPFELTQARTLFESEAAALAATTITADEVAALDALVERMRRDGESGDGALHEDADHAFHLGIARATRNAGIIDIVERLWAMRTELDQVKRVYDAICGVSPEGRVAEHQAIVDALRARDPAGARDAMRHHFACITEAMLATTEAHAIEEARRRTEEARRRFLEDGVPA